MTDATTAAAAVEPRPIDAEAETAEAVPAAPASLALGRRIFEELTTEGAPFHGVVDGPQPATLSAPDWSDIYTGIAQLEKANRRALDGGDTEALDRVFTAARVAVFAPARKPAPVAA
jgi:hypothetical protein